MTVNNTLVQSLVAEGFRGRVMSVHQLSWGATAIGGILVGFLAQTLGAPWALTLGGLVTAVLVGALIGVNMEALGVGTRTGSGEVAEGVSSND